MSAPTVPEGQSPPFAVVTPTDHSAWIIISTALGLSCVLLVSVIRICIRLTNAPPFGLDDALLGSATVISIIQSSITLYAASRGLGKSVELLSPEGLVNVQKLYYGGMILFVLALGLSKCSIVGLLLRMTPKKRQQRVFKGTLIFLAAWTVAATVAIALQCNLKHPWILVGEQCPGSLLRWQVIESLDIITELALIALAVYLVWNLHLSKMNKAVVIIAFGLRFPILIAMAFRFHTFDEAGYTVNPTLRETVFIVWSQAELNFSIVAATIPTLRRFVSGLATYYGALDQAKTNADSSYEIRSDGEFHMSPLTSAIKSADRDGHRSMHPDVIQTTKIFASAGPEQTAGVGVAQDPSRNLGTAHTTDGQVVGNWNNFNGNEGFTATHVLAQDSNSVGSNDSQQMIIKKDVTWTVEHGPKTHE